MSIGMSRGAARPHAALFLPLMALAIGSMPVRAQVVSESAEVAAFEARDSEDDRFTPSVALGGDWAVLGKRLDGRGGSAQVFRRCRDGRWAFDSEVRPAKVEPGDSFGAASVGMAVAGDLLAVARANRRAVFLFRRVGEAWVEEAKLEDASQDNFGDWLGWFGGDLIVASTFVSASKVQVYRQDASGIWSPAQVLVEGRAKHVAMDSRTGRLAVMDPVDSDPSNFEIVVFEPGSQWREVARVPAGRLVGNIAIEGDLVAGQVVELGPSGYLVDRFAQVWRERDGGWDSDGKFALDSGLTLALCDGRVLLGDALYSKFFGEPSLGAVWVYARRNGEWVLDGRLRAEDRFLNRSLGSGLSVWGGEVLVSGTGDAFLFRPFAIPGSNVVADEGVDRNLVPAAGQVFRYETVDTTGLGATRSAVLTLPNQSSPYEETVIDWSAEELCGAPSPGWFEFRFDSRVEGPGGVEWALPPGSDLSELSEHGSTPGDGAPRTHVYINRDCDVELAVRTAGAELAMDNFVQRPLRLPALGSFDVREAGEVARLGFVGNGEVFLFASFVKRLRPLLFPQLLITGELWLGEDLRLIGQAPGAGLGVPRSFEIGLPAVPELIGVPIFLQALQVDLYSGLAPNIGSPIREVILAPAGL